MPTAVDRRNERVTFHDRSTDELWCNLGPIRRWIGETIASETMPVIPAVAVQLNSLSEGLVAQERPLWGGAGPGARSASTISDTRERPGWYPMEYLSTTWRGLMGHEQTSTTLDRYTHSTRCRDRRVPGVFDAYPLLERDAADG